MISNIAHAFAMQLGLYKTIIGGGPQDIWSPESLLPKSVAAALRLHYIPRWQPSFLTIRSFYTPPVVAGATLASHNVFCSECVTCHHGRRISRLRLAIHGSIALNNKILIGNGGFISTNSPLAQQRQGQSLMEQQSCRDWWPWETLLVMNSTSESHVAIPVTLGA
jgi:hypothetical protein